MYIFDQNINKIYGKEGKKFIATLPRIIEKLTKKFSITDIIPFSNLTYNFVASGKIANNDIVLKISYDKNETKMEFEALNYFQDFGAVKVINYEENVLILEKALDGNSLKSYFPNNEQTSLTIACNVIQKLHKAKTPNTKKFPNIRDWLKKFDNNFGIPLDYMQKARKLRNHLLSTNCKEVLLHGDLHHDNILQNNDKWVVIDPKGVIGDSAYEIGAFIRNPIPDLLKQKNAKDIILNRISICANILNIPVSRIASWCFVQNILCWHWAIEDNIKIDYWQNLAELLFSIE